MKGILIWIGAVAMGLPRGPFGKHERFNGFAFVWILSKSSSNNKNNKKKKKTKKNHSTEIARLLQTVTVTKHPLELHFVPKAGLPTFRCSGVQRSGHKPCEGPEITQFKNFGESGSLCVLRVPHTAQSWCFQCQVKVVESQKHNHPVSHQATTQRDLFQKTCAPIFKTFYLKSSGADFVKGISKGLNFISLGFSGARLWERVFMCSNMLQQKQGASQFFPGYSNH